MNMRVSLCRVQIILVALKTAACLPKLRIPGKTGNLRRSNLTGGKSPAEYGADIVVGDFQPLGISMNFGGPHVRFIACKEAYLRQLPGRIVGLTQDKDGREAFSLTLQTREQHIRREKATSNICTNNALMALAATVYLSVMGPQGIKEIADISIQRAHYMAESLAEIPGISVLYNDFLYEFVIKTGIPSSELIKKLAQWTFS